MKQLTLPVHISGHITMSQDADGGSSMTFYFPDLNKQDYLAAVSLSNLITHMEKQAANSLGVSFPGTDTTHETLTQYMSKYISDLWEEKA